MAQDRFLQRVCCTRNRTPARLAALLTAAAGLLTAHDAAAAPAQIPAFVQATHQRAKDTAPLRHHPLNVLDGDATTTWCVDAAAHASDSGDPPALRLVFSAPQPVDAVRITTVPDAGSRVSTVRISDGATAVELPFNGQLEYVGPLGADLEGTEITLAITETDSTAPVGRDAVPAACLAEVTLLSKGTPMGGTRLRRALRAKMRWLITGPWQGEPFGAPESVLTFKLDGTWQWSYQPLLGGDGTHNGGEYVIRGERLLVRQHGGRPFRELTISHARVRIDPTEEGVPRTDYDTLRIAGFDGALAGSYNNASF